MRYLCLRTQTHRFDRNYLEQRTSWRTNLTLNSKQLNIFVITFVFATNDLRVMLVHPASVSLIGVSRVQFCTVSGGIITWCDTAEWIIACDLCAHESACLHLCITITSVSKTKSHFYLKLHILRSDFRVHTCVFNVYN